MHFSKNQLEAFDRSSIFNKAAYFVERAYLIGCSLSLNYLSKRLSTKPLLILKCLTNRPPWKIIESSQKDKDANLLGHQLGIRTLQHGCHSYDFSVINFMTVVSMLKFSLVAFNDKLMERVFDSLTIMPNVTTVVAQMQLFTF